CSLSFFLSGLELSINDHAADFSISTLPGPPISLSCLVHNSSQEEELLWYRGDGKVDLKDGNRMNISNICVSPVTESDNGVAFSCRLARDTSIQVSVILDVHFLPELSGEELLHVEEEKDATLSCNTKSNPQAQATWYRNNNPLTLEQNYYHLYQTSEVFQLSITKVQKSDNGTYSCVVNSYLGERRKDFHLIVEDKKPVFPKEAVIAAAVVVSITIFFGIIAQKDKICKVQKAL
ncbi:TMIG1 protein, partial [Turnix velox]|nr:TMIG1 protein [Turnix velox]